MSMKILQSILQTAPLERETKLQVIDALSQINDERKTREIIKLLVDWRNTDLANERLLAETLEKLKQTYAQHTQEIEGGAQRAALQIADTIVREKKIHAIRHSINNNV